MIFHPCPSAKPLTDGEAGLQGVPEAGGSLPCLSSAAGPPPKGAAPCAKGPEVNAPVVSGTPVPKAAGAEAPNDGGVRGGALPRIVRSRTLGPRFRREGQLRAPHLVCLSRRSLTRRSRHLSVGTAFQTSLVGIILNQETALRPCRPMGMASHPEASKPADPDIQSEPVDAGGAKRASPSQGAAGGDNGDGNGAEGGP